MAAVLGDEGGLGFTAAAERSRSLQSWRMFFGLGPGAGPAITAAHSAPERTPATAILAACLAPLHGWDRSKQSKHNSAHEGERGANCGEVQSGHEIQLG